MVFWESQVGDPNCKQCDLCCEMGNSLNTTGKNVQTTALKKVTLSLSGSVRTIKA